jgi:hypothetical protein
MSVVPIVLLLTILLTPEALKVSVKMKELSARLNVLYVFCWSSRGPSLPTPSIQQSYQSSHGGKANMYLNQEHQKVNQIASFACRITGSSRWIIGVEEGSKNSELQRRA